MTSSDFRDSDDVSLATQPDAEHDRHAQPVDAEEAPRLPFPVVGIGASAGGLEAAIDFFQAMHPESGMAFVLVQHLPPDRETMIAEILSKKTKMTVQQVDEGTEIEPNHVYVIRPGRTLTMEQGRFRLGEPLERPMHTRPIDDFFRSLAEEQRERAIAIVLSGMGSNGSAGAQAIKAVGGLCIAQDPDSAAFPSMPRHLIDAGYADYILRPSDMPETLLAYAGHPYARERGGSVDRELQREQQHIREILAVLRTRTRHDFSGYKKPTLVRRIQRRMGLARVTKLGDYARILRQTPSEVISLADDLLIHVTGFFRDPEAWETLREKVVVPLVGSREGDTSIRAWVAACSSGEEAYTLAMLLVEEAERVDKALDIKIFATDTAERTLQNARHGAYPGGIESEITPTRLERFFQREDAIYRVRPELRELVVFAPQNVLADPPFSRLDIITCRNLLIYLEPDLQQRVLSLLHFGLREGGALFLGTSETAGSNEELFEAVDKKARIFRRVGPTRHGSVDFPLPRVAVPSMSGAEYIEPGRLSAPQKPSISQLTTRALLEHHTPAAVTIDRDFRVLYYHGDTTPFLSQPSGEPTRDLMAIVRDPIRGALRAAVHRAFSQPQESCSENAWIEKPDGGREQICVTVSPLHSRTGPDCLVVSFRKVADWPSEVVPEAPLGQESAEALRRMRDELQSTVEELQTSNEELKAAHEEVVSTNEELQSTNEELETSREEMQSLNEELTTVNSQLQAKMEEYQAVTNDLASLLTSTDIAVLFLDTRFRIRRFTPQVKDLLDVIATDVGRPLSDLARKFEDPHLLREAAQVLERLVPQEREISVEGGRWFVRRLTPYRTAENRIDGVVVTFVETTARHRAEEAMRESEGQFRRAIEEAPIPVILQAENGEVLQISRAWAELMGFGLRDLPVLDSWLGHVRGEEASTLRHLLRELFRGAIHDFDLEFSIRTRTGEERRWSFSANSPGAMPDGRRICVGMAVDVTDRNRALSELHASKDAIESASAMKDQFLANISHELRTPLSVILMWSKLLAKSDITPAEQREAVDAIVRSAEVQRRLIEDLLDTTRIASGKLRVLLKPVSVQTVIKAAIDLVQPLASSRELTLEVNVPGPEDKACVLGDASRLEQVIWILLTNAVKFTPKGGTVRLDVHREGDEVVLTVSDTGRGISLEFLPQIFVPFSQADDSSNRSRGGLGLGLSIARSLVQLHNGSISATSEGEGKGSTFAVRLPIGKETVEIHADYASDDASLLDVGVLLVEDNEDALRAVRAALEAAGARVTAVTSAKSAIASFAQIAPQLIVSDLNMPDMDGLEFMRRIRGIEEETKMASAKAIALTAMATRNDRIAALESGYDDFITKPVDPAILIVKAREVMDMPRH